MTCALYSKRGVYSLVVQPLLLASLAFIAAQPSFAQDINKKAAPKLTQDAAFREQINGNTIGVLGGTLNGTYVRVVDDIAKVVDDGDNLRVLPIVGKGGGQNLRDLLYLKGVDLAVVSALSLLEYKDQQHFQSLSERVCFVSVLYPEEVHILSDKIETARDLSGKVVAFQGTGSKLVADVLFEALGVKPSKMVSMNMFDAADKMKVGEVDALIYLAGKPISGADRLESINKNLKLVEIPFTDTLVDKLFLPSYFTKEDYPAFVGQLARRDTAAVGVVLVAYNWKGDSERSRRVEKFTHTFLGRFSDIVSSKNSHPKWKEVELTARLPNWRRCAAAQSWIDLATKPKSAPTATATTPAQPARATDEKGQREALFREFLKWQQEKQGR